MLTQYRQEFCDIIGQVGAKRPQQCRERGRGLQLGGEHRRQCSYQPLIASLRIDCGAGETASSAMSRLGLFGTGTPAHAPNSALAKFK